MINRFIADLKIESRMAPLLYNRENSTVLDLSRRRDSVETRKTPSPYNTSSNASAESPKPHSDQVLVQNSSSSSKLSSEHSSVVCPIPTYAQDPILPNSQSLSMYYYHRQQAELAQSVFQHRNHTQHPQASPRLVEPSLPEDRTTQAYPYDALKTTAVALQQQIISRTSPPIQIKTENRGSSPNVEPKSPPQPAISTVNPPAANALPSLIYPKLINRDGKVPRPFKAYPRDPLAMAATFTATDALLDTQKAEKYSAFRKRMLEQIHASNGGRPTITNPKMRRNGINSRPYQEEHLNDSSSGNEDVTSPRSDLCNNNNSSESLNQNGMVKDAAYYERRKKNNAAAKKSRDRRRIKEDEIAVRAAFLEHENIELRIELAALKNQLALMTANSNR